MRKAKASATSSPRESCSYSEGSPFSPWLTQQHIENGSEIRQEGLENVMMLDRDVSAFDALDFGIETAACSFLPSLADLPYNGTTTDLTQDNNASETSTPSGLPTPIVHDGPNSNIFWVPASTNNQSTLHLNREVPSSSNGNHRTHDGSDDWLRGADTQVDTNITDQNILSGILTPVATDNSVDTVNLSSSAKDLRRPFLDSQQSDAKSKNSWVRKLAEANVKLFEHASTMPSALDVDCETPRPSERSHSNDSEHDAQEQGDKGGFAIDVTFELSRQLLVILSEICPANTDSQANPKSAKYDFSSTSNAAKGTRHGSDALSSPHMTTSPKNKWMSLRFDAGSTLLVLSCYTRILDIYNGFFDFVLASLSHPNGNDLLRRTRLPSFVIGSFSLHSSTLQITLMIRFVEEVFERLRKVFSQMDFLSAASNEEHADGLGSSPDSPGVSEATIRATRCKETSVVRKMNELRRQLQRSAII